ncbi:hypothetical protein ACSSS7_006289 [Eimeria intestinalis]
MARVWNIGAAWQIIARICCHSWSLLLCLAIIAGCRPIAAFQEAPQKAPPPSGYQVGGQVPSTARDTVQLPGAAHVDPQRDQHSSVGDLIGRPHREHEDAAHISIGMDPISASGHINREPAISERRPTPSKRSLRLSELSEVQQANADTPSVVAKAPHTVTPEEKGAREVIGYYSSKAPLIWEENLDYQEKALLTRSSEGFPQRHLGTHQKDFEEQTDMAEESADQRKTLNLPLSFRAFSESVSIPSPLAHSLLYRTRDITNPLNLANFLAEGQEWLIPGTGSLWEGLGRRMDSLFSGLFLKTASVLPDYTRNVIICYKEYKPSMWIEMFGLRNQFLRQLASLFQGTHRMQSVYLRNLGMEIFEVPPLWHVGEFIATVLKLKHFVSHVYTDHLVTDFDTETQASIKEGIESQGFAVPSGGSNRDTFQEKQHEYLDGDTPVPAEARQNQGTTQKAASHRRLEVMTNDPFTWQQWAIVDSGPSRWGIEAPTAWDVWTGYGLKPRFTVAVIDSGVDYEHPDLKNQIWRNPDEICGNGIDDDFNGFVDDCIGWDFVKGTSMPMDENGHGTASAGIIAAEPNNGIGLTGVCWGCDILVLKALNEEIKGTISAFARSLDYAIGKGVMISNNSYGGRGSGFRGLEEAVQRARQAGMIVVAAAGNYNGNNDNDKQPVFPASYDLDNVVSVAAISRNGQLAPFSSYGKRQVDVAAPGANIMTTSAKKSYRSVSGTSFAVPMVTGTLALLWTRRPHLNYRQVIQRMLRSVKKNPHLEGLIATAGTVDAWSTLANEDLLDPYAARPVLPMTCVSAACSPYASCTYVQGTPRCVCNHGFEGDGKICKDIDECIFSPCGPASVCVNTVGSYQCKCRKGFQQTQEACIDIDECALGQQNLIPSPCPPQARCYNFSGTYDCICPHGTVWNGLSGSTSQCLKINSPSRGPCVGNGGCGTNALCQAFFTAAEATRKCVCVPGFKPLRIGNQEVATAMAKSLMSSFDNTVCIREDVLSEEQAYYLISMHRERMRSLREVPEGRVATGHILPAGEQSRRRHYGQISTGQVVEPFGSPISPTFSQNRLAAGSMSNSLSSAAPRLTSLQQVPISNDVTFHSSPQQLPKVPLQPAPAPVPLRLPDKQQIVTLPRGSCLLGVCFT